MVFTKGTLYIGYGFGAPKKPGLNRVNPAVTYAIDMSPSPSPALINSLDITQNRATEGKTNVLPIFTNTDKLCLPKEHIVQVYSCR